MKDELINKQIELKTKINDTACVIQDLKQNILITKIKHKEDESITNNDRFIRLNDKLRYVRKDLLKYQNELQIVNLELSKINEIKINKLIENKEFKISKDIKTKQYVIEVFERFLNEILDEYLVKTVIDRVSDEIYN